MTYTVIDHVSGEAIKTGLSAEAAAHLALSDNGGEYEIRHNAYPNFGWTLWCGGPQWGRLFKTHLGSLHEDEQLARAEIFERVCSFDWITSPIIMTDESYRRLLEDK